MKFITLVKKELFESRYWLLLAFLIMLLWSYWHVNEMYMSRLKDLDCSFYIRRFTLAAAIPKYYLSYGNYFLSFYGVLIPWASAVLGLIFAVQQFWVPSLKRTWAFLLHRPVNRRTVICSKITAAAIGLFVIIGVIWCGVFWRINQFAPVFMFSLRDFIVGWLHISAGLIVYLGCALAAISSGKWHIKRFFALGISALILLRFFNLSTISAAVIMLIFGFILLGVQLFYTFINKEF